MRLFSANPRVGLVVGSFAATAVVVSTNDNPSTSQHPLLRNPFRSLNPPAAGESDGPTQLEKPQRGVKSSLLSNDPMTAWATVDTSRPATLPVPTKAASSEDKSLLDYVGVGESLASDQQSLSSSPPKATPPSPKAGAGWWRSGTVATTSTVKATEATRAPQQSEDDAALLAFADVSNSRKTD